MFPVGQNMFILSLDCVNVELVLICSVFTQFKKLENHLAHRLNFTRTSLKSFYIYL